MPRIMQSSALALATAVAVVIASLVGGFLAGSVDSVPVEPIEPIEQVEAAGAAERDLALEQMATLEATTQGNSFSSPVVVTGHWPGVVFDSQAATTQSGEPRLVGSARYLRRTMWARWKAPASGFVSFTVYAGVDDTGLNVYTGSTFGTLRRVATNDNHYQPVDGANGSTTAPFTGAGILGMQVTAGTVYYLQVGSATSLPATTDAAVPGFASLYVTINQSNYVQPNDFRAKAATLTLGPGATISTTAYVNGSTMESWEPTDNNVEPAAKRIGSVWYRWTAPQTGDATLTICAWHEFMSIGVFQNYASDPGFGVGDLSAIEFAFNDFFPCPNGEYGARTNFTARQGVIYLFQIAKTFPLPGYESGADRSGTLTLDVDFALAYIEKISPTSGPLAGGTTVTITGQQLSVFGKTTVVKFGTKIATVLAGSTETQLKVKVPKGLKLGSVPVTVTIDTIVSNAKTYTYK